MELYGVKRRKSTGKISAGVGGTMIMVIFVVLCLTIFAVLSFTAAYSDMKLSDKALDITKDYYIVQADAEEMLADINNAMGKSKSLSAATVAVSNIDGIKITNEKQDTVQIYYECLGNENQKICVTLELRYDDELNKPIYNILTWNLANIEVPEYGEELIDLWEGSGE